MTDAQTMTLVGAIIGGIILFIIISIVVLSAKFYAIEADSEKN